MILTRTKHLEFSEVFYMNTKENRQRNRQKKFYVDDLENQIIEKRMKEANLTNFGDFARKSCLDKKIYTL
ncbi:plasmid mobilization protein, partial [[Ruminococcus] torques]|uniref:plasmid mobilization protein n=1 Tax=[Ruminococcus] torques TaxID=33039 RepID=UPI003F697ED0